MSGVISDQRPLQSIYYDFLGQTVTINGGTPTTIANGEYLHKSLGSPVFDPTDGLGIPTDSSIVVLSTFSFKNVRLTATMLYRTDAPNANRFGLVLRSKGWWSANSRRYIYVQVRNGVAEIAEATNDVLGSVLGSAPFPLAAGVAVTIVAELTGTSLVTSFTADGGTPATVTPPATVTIEEIGALGFRSGPTKVGHCRNLRIEERP
jgi:hypothetical protein